MKWISVFERLPEDGKRVLVFTKKHGVFTTVYPWPDELEHPTHWMPLPDKPK